MGLLLLRVPTDSGPDGLGKMWSQIRTVTFVDLVKTEGRHLGCWHHSQTRLISSSPPPASPSPLSSSSSPQGQTQRSRYAA